LLSTDTVRAVPPNSLHAGYTAGILNQNGQAYPPDELKSLWQRNWLRTHTQLEQKQEASEPGGAAYEQDF
jgi:hypothetical protein